MGDGALTPEAVTRMWIVTLAIYAVVLVVVAVLLTLVLMTARRIREGVSEIWNVGQKIANNTIHIGLLGRTNIVAGRILGSAVGVVHATAALATHAETCTGCPECVIGPAWSRGAS
ncbi:MAG: hypothetical protein H0W15_13620 [Gemmatimonadales bacterium]|nr:hypothetical protein [Gemmatimonadales bacterium]